MTPIRTLSAVLTLGVSLSACAQTSQEAPARAVARQSAAAASKPGPRPAAAAQVPTSTAVDASLPKVLVHRSPSCGCCGGWVEHMRRHGFAVDVHMTEELEPIKKRLGVPLGKGSCHTAEVGRLVVEGHVPAGDVKRLLAMKDGSRGLVLPGMPLGSPGMEMPDGRVQRYTVEKVNADGTTAPFATHGP